jgi:type I restriction enzyme M protein
VPDGQQWKQLVVSKVFDNEDFGYHKITVERPLRLNFHATPERLARLEDETAFKNLATSTKKDEAALYHVRWPAMWPSTRNRR